MQKLRTFNSQGDRYVYDWGLCSSRNGWAQVDTKQDASYFGIWTNPTAFKIFQYTEGDEYLTTCENAEEYKTELLALIDWQKQAGYWKGIDAGFDDKLKQAFVDLGLSEYLH